MYRQLYLFCDFLFSSVVGIVKGRVKSVVKVVKVVRKLDEESIPEKRRDVMREREIRKVKRDLRKRAKRAEKKLARQMIIE
jgi:hypothetical protein